MFKAHFMVRIQNINFFKTISALRSVKASLFKYQKVLYSPNKFSMKIYFFGRSCVPKIKKAPD